MDFTWKKLPGEKVNSLHRVRVDHLKPCSMNWAPAYLYFESNNKLVAIKGPIDFFSADEIDKLKSAEFVYFNSYIKLILPIQEQGKSLRVAMGADGNSVKKINDGPYIDVVLPPTSFEFSDFALRAVSSLWRGSQDKKIGVEPILTAILTDEICDPLSASILVGARDWDIEKFSEAILKSSWVVFFALHLGFCDLRILNEVRLQAFKETMSGRRSSMTRGETDELIKLVHQLENLNRTRSIQESLFSGRIEKISHKLESKIARIKRELLNHGLPPPSIFGMRGFIDV